MPADQPQGAALDGRPRILCVDDDPHVLEGLRDLLGRSFEISTAGSGIQALELLQAEPDGFAVVISDMRMPRMSGAEFLRAARLAAPTAVRMLLTGQAELEDALRAVNGARLFRYLHKPCEPGELVRACRAAVEQHRLEVAERALLERTLGGVLEALSEALAVVFPAGFGLAARTRTLARELALAVGAASCWEVEVAALLAPLGVAALPQLTAEKLYAGAPLGAEEAAMVQRASLAGWRAARRVPRLEGVADILRGFDLRGCSSEAMANVLEARVLWIASDYAALEARGRTSAEALGAMRSRGVYDEALLEAFAALVDRPPARRPQPLALGELRVGMTLAAEVRAIGGRLLAAAGQPVSELLLERLMDLGPGAVREPVLALDERGD